MKPASFLICILTALFAHFTPTNPNPATIEDSALIAPADLCPLCLEPDCIFQEINNNVNPAEPTDAEIHRAILAVCQRRGIANPATIDTLMNEYYIQP